VPPSRLVGGQYPIVDPALYGTYAHAERAGRVSSAQVPGFNVDSAPLLRSVVRTRSTVVING
jgi:hypothetical protein